MTNIDWRETALVRTQGMRRKLLGQVVVLGAIVAVLWLVEMVDTFAFHGALDGLGVQPRTLAGLSAIMVAPLLHAGFGHLLANTIPLVVLGWLVMVRRTSDFFIVGLAAALASGLGVWLLGGANTVHIGVSGVIFGFLGYLLARGYYERSLRAIGLACWRFSSTAGCCGESCHSNTAFRGRVTSLASSVVCWRRMCWSGIPHKQRKLKWFVAACEALHLTKAGP